MAIAKTATYEPSADEKIFMAMNEAVAKLTDQPKELAEKIIKSISEKMKEKKMSFAEIKTHFQEKFKHSPKVLTVFNKILPTQEEISKETETSKIIGSKIAQLEETKKNETEKVFKNIEEAGFIKETWEKIRSTTGNVVDTSLAFLKSFPRKEVIIAVALIALLGSSVAALAFIKGGFGATATSTFGALKTMFGITPETFGSMVPGLKTILATAPSIGMPA